MNKIRVVSKFVPKGDQPVAIGDLTRSIATGAKYQTLHGVTGSGKTFVMAKTIEQTQKATLVICHNKTLAGQLYNEFVSFLPDNAVELFISPYNFYQPQVYNKGSDSIHDPKSSTDEGLKKARLKALVSLCTRRDVVVVASTSCLFGVCDPAVFKRKSVEFSLGKGIDLTETARGLLEAKYESGKGSGSFVVSESKIELKTIYSDESVEIDVSGGVITQILVNGSPQDTFVAFPCSWHLMDWEDVSGVIPRIKEELNHRIRKLGLVQADRLKGIVASDLKDIKTQKGNSVCIESYTQFFQKESTSLLDFFPDDYLTIIDESHITYSQINSTYLGVRSRKQDMINQGFKLPSYIRSIPLTPDQFTRRTSFVLFVSATPGAKELALSRTVASLIVRPTGFVDPEIEVRPTINQIEGLVLDIKERVEVNERSIVLTTTKKAAEETTQELQSQGIRAVYLHCGIPSNQRPIIMQQFKEGSFDVLVGINLLREGLDIPQASLIAVLQADRGGFLRTSTSLLQIIGRVARNINGKAVLFADKRTPAIEQSIARSELNRTIQRGSVMSQPIPD